MSNDGTKVVFYSYSTNLDPLDRDAIPDIYVKDLATGDISLVSTSEEGIKGNGSSYDPRLSADGTRVAFWSFATNLDPADTDVESDVYVKDLVTGDVILASTSDDGVKGNDASYAAVLSSNGRQVGFESYATNLDPNDPDIKTDVYFKDLETGALTLVSTSDDGVKGNDTSLHPAVSGDGARVAFYSLATNLDPADGDTIADVYVQDL